MKKAFRIHMVAMTVIALLSGCVTSGDKAPVASEEVDVTTEEMRNSGIMAGELDWCDLHEGELTWYRPYQIWGYTGADCTETFIDLASREGDDMFVVLYSRPLSGGPWSMVDYNDDCYEGTLNACLHLETRADREYQLLATTYNFVAYGGVGATVENYHLRLNCNDESGQCYDPSEEPEVLCGSRGLPPCAEGFYCDWADDSCGAADVPGVCTPIPEICATIYAPVCGCDGETHSSPCWAAMSGIDVMSVGPCE